jgi:sigma-B regulation protein RsbU (phosphoserine phosphatase)
VHRRLDGTPVPVDVTLNPVEIDGRPALIVVWHDLTAIKRAETELKARADELQSTNDRLRRDLRAAARVQQAFLPATLPDTAPIRVAWAFRPCEELGGDLLNLFPIGDGHLGAYLLDVSGHGVPASLLAVAVGHALNPHGDPVGLRRPAEVVRRVNERLCGDRTEQLVTLFYGVLDLDTCTLTYANAGHPRPVLLSPGAEPAVLTEGGLMAGVTAEAEYRPAEVRLRPGDRLWVYSDGLPEAMSPAGELFGPARLAAAFRHAGVKLSDAIRVVLGVVEGWTGPGGPRDDVSVVALEVGETAGGEGHADTRD